MRATAARLRVGSWVLVPLGIGIASRVYSSALLHFFAGHQHHHHVDPFVAWDAQWYLRIAALGYHAVPVQPSATGGHYDFAFFPAWPMTIRAVTAVVPPRDIVAVVLANLLFILAAVLLWRVLRDRFEARVATGAVALLAFSPPAYVLSMAYSEPLFLVVIGLYFLARGRAIRQSALAALAMVTRIAGAAILASALVGLIRDRGADRRRWLLILGAGTAAFAAWWIFIALLVHDPLGFLRGAPSWAPTTGAGQIVNDVRDLTVERVAWLGFVGTVLLGGLLIIRRDVELGVFALANVAFVLLPGAFVSSAPRYMLVAFPAFAGLSQRLGRRGTIALLIVFALGQWLFVRYSSYAAP